MHFDIDKFFDRIQQEGLTKQEAGQAVIQEIQDAETQKVAFADQASLNPSFFKFLCGQIDSYITYLKVLHVRISHKNKKYLEGLAYDPDKAKAYHTMRLLMQLEKIEARR